MKLSIFSMMLATACFFSFGVHAQGALVDQSTGESFPSEVSFDFNGKHYELQATGVATRKKLIVKVYSIASYLQKGVVAGGGDKFAQFQSDDNAKQLTMKYVRDVSASQMQQAFKDAFVRVFPGDQYATLQGDINNFLQFFTNDIKKGDEYILRWTPGGNVQALINNKVVGSVSNAAFAKGLWSVWLGQGSIVNRDNLVSLLK